YTGRVKSPSPLRSARNDSRELAPARGEIWSGSEDFPDERLPRQTMVVPSHALRGRPSGGAPATSPGPMGRGEAAASMAQRFAEGDNYSIELEGSRAVCRVWSRPDLDSARGAAL